MAMNRYEIIEHTADVGLRTFGQTLEELFQNAAYGLLAYTVVDLDAMSPEDTKEVSLEAPDDADLLVDWLNDRLFRFDAEHEIHAWSDLRAVGAGRLSGSSRFRRVDWAHDRFHAEVKSVTYHGLRLESRGDLWVAEVILDI